MSTLRLFIVAMTAALLLTGCQSAEKTKVGEFAPNENDSQKVAQAYADDIMNGIKTGDYKLFSKNFLSASKEKVTEKNFKTTVSDMNEKVGKIQQWTYLTVLDKAPFKSFVWKASFQKDIKDKDGKPAKLDTDMLFQLLMGKTDKGYVILSFYFQ